MARLPTGDARPGLSSSPPTPDRLAALVGLFRALADRTRLRILALLARGEICVCDIHGTLDIPQPTASRHLAYLRRAGLVATRKRGLWVHYRLAESNDATLQALVTGAIAGVDAGATSGRDPGRLGRRTLAAAIAAEPACCRPASSE